MVENSPTLRHPAIMGIVRIVRIVFGVIWLIDAQFKWRPSFIQDFVSFLTGALDKQPALVKA